MRHCSAITAGLRTGVNIMTKIYAGAKPHLEAADKQLKLILEYASEYHVGPTWFRDSLKTARAQIKAGQKKLA